MQEAENSTSATRPSDNDAGNKEKLRRKKKSRGIVPSPKFFQTNLGPTFVKDMTHPETFAKDKAMKNPMIPVGMVLTVLALGGGLRYMVRRDSYKQQLFMRYRISAQFFTVAALVGTYYFYLNRARNDQKK